MINSEGWGLHCHGEANSTHATMKSDRLNHRSVVSSSSGVTCTTHGQEASGDGGGATEREHGASGQQAEGSGEGEQQADGQQADETETGEQRAGGQRAKRKGKQRQGDNKDKNNKRRRQGNTLVAL